MPKNCKGWYVPWICGYCRLKRKCHKKKEGCYND